MTVGEVVKYKKLSTRRPKEVNHSGRMFADCGVWRLAIRGEKPMKIFGDPGGMLSQKITSLFLVV